MGCMTQKCIVQQADRKDLEKDWRKGNNVYSIGRAIGRERV